MSASGRDLIDVLSDAIGRYFTAEHFSRLASVLHKRTTPIPEDELRTHVVLGDRKSIVHDITESLTLVTAPELEEEEEISPIDYASYWRRIPKDVRAFSVTETDVGSGVTFPNSGLMGAALVVATGSQHKKLDPYDSSDTMDLAALAFSLAINIKNLGAGTYGLLCKRDIASTTNAGIEIWFSGGNTINVRIADGTNTTLLSATVSGIDLTDSNRHTVIINVPASGNIEVFVDNVSQGTQARGSVANVNNSRAAYLMARDNAGVIGDELDAEWSWFTWKKGEIFSSSQRTEYHTDFVLDLSTSTTTEVLTVPGIKSIEIKPNCQEGGFVAKT